MWDARRRLAGLILAGCGAILCAGDDPPSAPPRGGAISAGTVSVEAGEPAKPVEYSFRLVEPPADQLDAGQRVPLVVFLHGAGERGRDNQAQIKHFVRAAAETEFQRSHPCFVLALQCPSQEWWAAIDLAAWRAHGESPHFAAQPTSAMQAVIQAMDQVMAGRPIDPDRVYLTGLSMGGFGSFDLAARRPEVFAAVVPICGGGDPQTAERMCHIPFFIVHGADDPIVPVALSQRMRDALTAAGATPRYQEPTGVGHASWGAAYSQTPGSALEWMFEQKRVSAAAGEPSAAKQ